MDRGDWGATVHGVAKSRTRLSNFTHSCSQLKAFIELRLTFPLEKGSDSRLPLDSDYGAFLGLYPANLLCRFLTVPSMIIFVS